MARTWLSIQVELVSGRGELLWPRPGRTFAAARSHTFAQLAAAVNVSFARWDLAHLHQFTLADGTNVAPTRFFDGDAPDGTIDDAGARLSRLQPGEQFAYVFDLGDDWAHLCTVAPQRIDPLEEIGHTPGAPMAYWGWGDLPDQYGRRWNDDDGEDDPPQPPARALSDLPPLLPGWGS
jgi:Plasmid pRiA4b ORF-3-like protein